MGALHSRGQRGTLRTGRGLLVGIAAAMLLVLPGGVEAASPSTSCVVTARGTHTTYGTLQAALDASPAGAKLLVRGTCIGASVISKDVTIRGSRGEDEDGTADRAILDGGGTYGGDNTVLTVLQGASLEASGLIVKGGSSATRAGGINNAGTLVLKNSVVSGNFGGGGPGVFNAIGAGILNDGIATVVGSVVDNNAGWFGGNIVNRGTLLMKDSTITHGSARFSPGLANGGTATLIRTNVIDNDSPFVCCPLVGGGITNGGELTLISSLVSGNRAAEGAGIQNVGTARLIKSRVTGNLGTGILNGPPFLPGASAAQLFLDGSVISENFGVGIYNRKDVALRGGTRIGANLGGGMFNEPPGTVTGLTRKTFTPPNVGFDCEGCPPIAAS